MMRLFDKLNTAIIESSSHPIHKAVLNKKFKVLQNLISNKPYDLNKFYQGLPALAYAYDNNQYDYMLLLLCGGADPSKHFEYGSQSTLLHTAVSEKKQSIVKLLLMFGADPNIMSLRGISALQKAPENSMLRRTMEDTRDNYLTLQQSLETARQALKHNQLTPAGDYLQTVASCWEAAANNETSPFFKSFYYATALAITNIAYDYQASKTLETMIEHLQTLIQQQYLPKKEQEKISTVTEQYLVTFIFHNKVSPEKYCHELCSMS